MNHIYKKVWSRVRGCFVAVSEAMASAAQTCGKAAVITAAVTLIPSYVFATTVDGETYWNNIAFSFHDNGSSLIHSDYVINGSLTVPDRGSGWTFQAVRTSVV